MLRPVRFPCFTLVPPTGREASTLKATPLALQHAPLLHALYASAPGYFALLGTRVPTPVGSRIARGHAVEEGALA